MRCGKIVVAFPDSVTGTVRTAMSLSSVSNTSLPFVAVLTDPPDFCIRRNSVFRRLFRILGRPGLSQFRIERSKVVIALKDSSMLTVGTIAA